MKLQESFESALIKILSRLIIALAALAADGIITLVAMMALVTVGTVFDLTLPYRSIMVMVALAALVVIIALTIKHRASFPDKPDGSASRPVA